MYVYIIPFPYDLLQTPEARKINQDVVTFKSSLVTTSRSKDTLLLEGKLQTISFHLHAIHSPEGSTVLGSHDQTVAPSSECQLERLVLGMRSVSGVVAFLLGEWVVSASKADTPTGNKGQGDAGGRVRCGGGGSVLR